MVDGLDGLELVIICPGKPVAIHSFQGGFASQPQFLQRLQFALFNRVHHLQVLACVSTIPATLEAADRSRRPSPAAQAQKASPRCGRRTMGKETVSASQRLVTREGNIT